MASADSPSPVSVVVVSYNTVDKLRRCLNAIEPSHEVIVVDNASTDGSAQMVSAEFPNARLLSNATNRGFGAANNQGIAVARRDYVLLLNSDCYAEPGAIESLAKALAASGAVACGGLLKEPDGSIQQSVAGKLTLLAVFLEQSFLERFSGRARYWRTDFALEETKDREWTEVEQVMGACLMMRPLETFDERFFLYCEDTELCLRLRRHGPILYVPDAEFTHELGSSSKRDPWRGIAFYNRGKELYFAIHRGPIACAACWWFDRSGALLRLLIWSLATVATLGFKKGVRDRVPTFARVLTAPLRGPRLPTDS